LKLRQFKPSPWPHALHGIIDALGNEDFAERLLTALNEIMGVDGVAIFELTPANAKPLFAAGIDASDLQILCNEISSGAQLLAPEPAPAPGTEGDAGMLRGEADPFELRFQNIQGHGVILCSRSSGEIHVMALMCRFESGKFDDLAIAQLAEVAQVLIKVCTKQIYLCRRIPDLAVHFGSQESIDQTLRACGWGLTARERQVAVGIIRGMSALGISLELGLSEDTVTTYRKRTYRRLGIGSRHELFHKYLEALPMVA
jgi:DNA-binding CsgD family transcriptional regulator